MCVSSSYLLVKLTSVVTRVLTSGLGLNLLERYTHESRLKLATQYSDTCTYIYIKLTVQATYKKYVADT